jgi:hypothetical protein
MATDGLVFIGGLIGALFGADVEAAADLNGDEQSDLLVGAPGVASESGAYAGSMAVFQGPITAGLAFDDATATIMATDGGAMVGYSLATSHLNADALGDVALGSSYYFTESGTGAVKVLMGAGF